MSCVRVESRMSSSAKTLSSATRIQKHWNQLRSSDVCTVSTVERKNDAMMRTNEIPAAKPQA
jgi:hypothetical protein